VYVSDKGSLGVFPHLAGTLARPIRWELIKQQYDEMVKAAVALKRGTASSASNDTVNSLLPGQFFFFLQGPPSTFSSDASPGRSELPPSISAFSQINGWRLEFGVLPGEDQRPQMVAGTITS